LVFSCEIYLYVLGRILAVGSGIYMCVLVFLYVFCKEGGGFFRLIEGGTIKEFKFW